jgi:serine protease
MPHAFPRGALPLLAALVLGACGGGGGGGGGGDEPGELAGTILVPDEHWGVVAEAEPNGSTAQAQVLPPFQPGATLLVAGEGGVSDDRYGAVDTTDAFRLACPETQDVTLTLTASTDGMALGTFDLAVFDVGSGQPLGTAATAANPEVLVFSLAAGEPADVVVTCASGAGQWVLQIEGAAPPAGLATTALAPAGGAPSAEAVSYLLDEPDCREGRLVVRASGGRAEAERLAASVGASVRRRASSGSWVLEFAPRWGDSGRREAVARAARLARALGVRFAEPEWHVRSLATPDDPLFGRQWNLAAVGVPGAWDVTFGASSVVVGVIDTGIAAHPDLDAQRVGGYDFVDDPSYSGDGDGRDPDPTDPGDRSSSDGRSAWHGVHVAGIAVGRANDGVGIAGVAPGCRFMPLRALGVDGGTTVDVADALRYAAGLAGTDDGGPLAQPLRVVNMSLGTGVNAVELRTAVEDAAAAGTLMTASSGNDGGSVLYPAAYPEVLAVSSVEGRLVWASYSNSGPQVDLAAPGGLEDRDVAADGFGDSVLSCLLDETVDPTQPTWGYIAGTSMAAPHVAGAAALLFSIDPALTPAQCRQNLLSTCRDIDQAGTDFRTGAGLLQVEAAVRKTLADLGTPRADPPRLLLSSTSIRIPSGESVGLVNVMNGGGGTLHVASPVVSTDSGVPWLGAFTTAAPPGAAADAAQIGITVDRFGLGNGIHAGTVILTDGVETLGAVRVVLEVGSFPLTGAILSVVAQRAGTGQAVAVGRAYPWDGYRYVLKDVPPATYTVTAGTDLDGDGFFCEGPDWCGDFGGDEKDTVVVPSGGRVDGIDIRIGR